MAQFTVTTPYGEARFAKQDLAEAYAQDRVEGDGTAWAEVRVETRTGGYSILASFQSDDPVDPFEGLASGAGYF